MKRTTLKLKYTDFSVVSVTKPYLVQLLDTHYDVTFSEEPDLVIYGRVGTEFLNYDCLRVFYTGENIRPDFDLCDYAFTCTYSDNPRHYRFPGYATYTDLRLLTKPKDITRILQSKTRFNNFIYSNSMPQERIRFFKLLSKYKKVDSLGAVLNNTPDLLEKGKRYHPMWHKIKLSLMDKYKFTIAFENSSYPGYTTEKILDAFLANTIPIYWGNPLIHLDFNPNAFINCHDFDSFEQVVERVIEVDQNEALYRQMLSEPPYANNKIPQNIRKENVLKQLDHIVQRIGQLTPVAQRIQKRKLVTKAQIWARYSQAQPWINFPWSYLWHVAWPRFRNRFHKRRSSLLSI